MITEQQFWDVVEVCKVVRDLDDESRSLFLSVAAPYLSPKPGGWSCVEIGDLELWHCNMLSCEKNSNLFEPDECDKLLEFMKKNGLVSQ